MPKKLKIKVDGICSGHEIPYDVEELKLDCKEIWIEAFCNCRKALGSGGGSRKPPRY